MTDFATVRVDLGERSYDVRIGSGLISDAAGHIAPLLKRPFVPVITDETVAQHWRAPLSAALDAGGITAEWIVLPAGEGTKSWESLAALTDRLLALEVERSDHLIALGGGVIGDLVGFAASITKRGCNFIQIPTTLLAQVDSSVGGKTAINSAAGKNMIGAFHQPALVLADTAALATLPLRELRAGYAETVKYGLIDDAAFFGWCEANVASLLAQDSAVLAQAVHHAVAAKARIVGEDERETTGRRALLNLGHTFGHALEAETGFSQRLLHGEGVGTGMALAARYSARIGLMDGTEAQRICNHLAAAGLPVTLRDVGIQASGAALVAHMMHDKKREGGTLPFLLMRGVGQTFLAKDVDLADIAAFLDDQG